MHLRNLRRTKLRISSKKTHREDFGAYNERKDVEGFAHLATFEEIENNDFNLNIPRYVDSTPKEEEIDINSVFDDLEAIDKELSVLTKELNEEFKELGISRMI